MAPLHPAFVHLPIALLIFSLAGDFLFLTWRYSWTAIIGEGALYGSLAGAGLSIASGFVDAARLESTLPPGVGDRVEIHEHMGLTVLGLVAVISLMRWRLYRRKAKAIDFLYFAVALVVLALTLYQGWLGGKLVFIDAVGVATR